MRQTAAAAFPVWLKPFEGDCRDPYLDVRGLPTVGLAFLCPLSVALLCSWTLPSGELATPAAIHAAYDKLTALPKGMGGGWYQGKVGLTLTPHSFAVLYAQKLASFEKALRSSSHVGPAWDTLPGVCQLARMRSDWADGSASPWPKLDSALARGDWETAAAECWPIDAGPDPEDSTTEGRKTTQPAEYTKSYLAVRQLYRLASQFPDDELPDQLPDGALEAA